MASPTCTYIVDARSWGINLSCFLIIFELLGNGRPHLWCFISASEKGGLQSQRHYRSHIPSIGHDARLHMDIYVASHTRMRYNVFENYKTSKSNFLVEKVACVFSGKLPLKIAKKNRPNFSKKKSGRFFDTHIKIQTTSGSGQV